MYPNLDRKKIAIIALFTTYLLWGISIPIIKLVLTQIPPFTFAFLRFAFASLILVPFFIFDDVHHPIKMPDLSKMVVISILGPALTITLFYLGVARISAINAAVIHSLFPVIMAIAAVIFLGERLKKNIILGVIVAIIGGSIIIGQPFFDINFYKASSSLIGGGLLLASVITWTAYTIGSKELFEKYSFITITAFSFLIGMFFTAPFALFEYLNNPNWSSNITTSVIIGLVYMIIFSSIFAYLLYEWGIKLVSAARIGIISHTQIIWAVIGSYLLLGEIITGLFVIGAIFILVGIYITTWRIPDYHVHRGHKL